jgi:hypothetical protein
VNLNFSQSTYLGFQSVSNKDQYSKVSRLFGVHDAGGS